MNCKICGKPLTPQQDRSCCYHGRDYGFCSSKCYGQWLSRYQCGNKHPNWHGGPSERACAVCGKVYLSRKPNQKTCSKECGAILRSGPWPDKRVREKRYCLICNNIFEVVPSSHQITCGKKCLSIYKRRIRIPRVFLICEKCGIRFQVERCKIRRSGRVRKYCSRKCYDAVQRQRHGEQIHSWRGGISFEPYPFDWRKSLKETIRNRDQRTCMVCGAPENGTRLCVHHIDYDKKNLSFDNLISLCRSCHTKTNHNRKFWKRYLEQLMLKVA